MNALEAVADVRKAQERVREKVAAVLDGRSGVSVTLVLRAVLEYIDMERTVGAYLTLTQYARERREQAFYEGETLSEATSEVQPAAKRVPR